MSTNTLGMEDGWIKLWRKSIANGWLQNHKIWAFWTWCLMKATHREYDAIVGYQRIHLKPGQFVFGLPVASKETGLSIRQTRTAVTFLKNEGNLTVKTTNKFSIGTVVNWNTYQGEEVQNDSQNDRQTTGKRQHTRNIYTGHYFRVSEKEHRKYEEAYPPIDLIGEYKKMESWLESNPAKRPKSSYPRFINSWLGRAFKELGESTKGRWDDYPNL